MTSIDETYQYEPTKEIPGFVDEQALSKLGELMLNGDRVFLGRVSVADVDDAGFCNNMGAVLALVADSYKLEIKEDNGGFVLFVVKNDPKTLR